MKNLTYRDFVIPKKNGKPRKISAPSKELLKYQRNIMPILLKHFYHLESENNSKWIQHGFLPNRNCVSASQMHIGFEYTICMDIKNFFDSCYKHMFPEKIQKFKGLFHKDGYCAQGFATSPLMANIAYFPVAKIIKERLLSLHSDNKEIEDLFAFTMYADDIQISTNRKQLIPKIINIVEEESNKSNFSINKTKTRVRCNSAGYRKILGINVGKTNIRATRKIMRKIRAADHQGNFHSKGGLVNWSMSRLPKELVRQNFKSYFALKS